METFGVGMFAPKSAEHAKLTMDFQYFYSCYAPREQPLRYREQGLRKPRVFVHDQS
jgi:hypothetical protein